VPDEQSAPYWAAAAEHVLTVARCSRCRAYCIPIDVVCDRCGSTAPDYRFEPVTGRGSVRSWTVLRQSFLPGFDDVLPLVLVDVELDEQAELRMIGRLVDGADAPLRLGARVTVVFDDLGDGDGDGDGAAAAVPAFTLDQS
jgi:uncharacterized OB-fold protein